MSGAVELQVAEGVTARGLGRDAVGLTLAERTQTDDNRFEDAIEVVEQLEPTTHAAGSLAELYVAAKRYTDVIELTDGVENRRQLSGIDCPASIGSHSARQSRPTRAASPRSATDPDERQWALIDRLPWASVTQIVTRHRHGRHIHDHQHRQAHLHLRDRNVRGRSPITTVMDMLTGTRMAS